MMFKKSTLIAAGAAIFLAGAAQAADLGKGLKDGPVDAPRAKQNFEGFYAGLGVGGAILEDDAGGDLDGFLGNAIVGFDTRHQSIVLGLRVQGFLSAIEDDSETVQIDGSAGIGGRAGVVFNRTLVYGHLDHEWLFASSDIPAVDDALNDADLRQLVVGVGFETASPMFGSFTFGVEGSYLHGLGDADGLDGFRGVARAFRRF